MKQIVWKEPPASRVRRDPLEVFAEFRANPGKWGQYPLENDSAHEAERVFGVWQYLEDKSDFHLTYGMDHGHYYIYVRYGDEV